MLSMLSIKLSEGKYNWTDTKDQFKEPRLDISDPNVFAPPMLGVTAPPQCTYNSDCDDGNFCNGQEACVSGECVSGSDPCTGTGETCNESANQCDVEQQTCPLTPVGGSCGSNSECCSNKCRGRRGRKKCKE